MFLTSETHVSSWLWDARLGHVNFLALKMMSETEIVSGLPGIKKPTKVCKGCLVRKQSQNSFPTETQYRDLDKLELVQGDLCGLFSPPTPSKFVTFKGFHTIVENKTGKKLNTFHTDRGVSSYQAISAPTALKWV